MEIKAWNEEEKKYDVFSIDTDSIVELYDKIENILFLTSELSDEFKYSYAQVETGNLSLSFTFADKGKLVFSGCKN